MNVKLIVNPIAGSKASGAIRKIETLLKHTSHATFITQDKGDAFHWAKNHSTSDLIIVAGGDGTFNEAINGILSSRESVAQNKIAPLAFIPLGTTNVLAKELNIPEDTEKAVHLALTGTPKEISLGRINGSYFALMAGIGFDGEAVFRVNSSIKKITGKGAYVLSGMLALMNYNPPLIEVKTSEGTFTGYTAVVGKAKCYAGNFQVTPHAAIAKPVLDLCLFQGKTRKDLIRFAGGVIRKKHLTFRDVFYGTFTELEITSQEEVHIQTDGDYFGTLPAKIDVVKDAVRLVW